jgi:hypothetical protein
MIDKSHFRSRLLAIKFYFGVYTKVQKVYFWIFFFCCGKYRTSGKVTAIKAHLRVFANKPKAALQTHIPIGIYVPFT